MFGLGAIDFSGVLGLSSDMARDALFSAFRAGLRPGAFFSVSDTEINNILGQVLSKYRATSDVQVDDGTANAVREDVKSIIIGVLGLPKAGAYESEIATIVDGMSRNGVSLVPLGYVQGKTAPATSVRPVGPGAVIGASAGAAQWQPFRYAVADRSPTQFVQRKPVKKDNKLFWILGIGAAFFAISIGVLATRD